ncbi:hypothetical protein HanIR_Chr06g0283861 [Helianthus annuus]|nr:hypothetical protein HanIR_Chr06g0283861 [Helianthus annuus]
MLMQVRVCWVHIRTNRVEIWWCLLSFRSEQVRVYGISKMEYFFFVLLLDFLLLFEYFFLTVFSYIKVDCFLF